MAIIVSLQPLTWQPLALFQHQKQYINNYKFKKLDYNMNIFPEHTFDDIWKQLFLTLIGKIIFKENIYNTGENFENVHEKPQFWFLSWIWLISLSLNMINHMHLYRKNLLRHHKEVWKWKFKLISVSIQLSEMHVAGRAKVWTVGEKYRSDCKILVNRWCET